MPGNLLSAPVCHTGMPGRIWPITSARRTFSALVPIPLKVIPPHGAENFNIHVGNRVDNHFTKAANPQQFSLNPVQIKLPQLLDGD